MTNLWGRYKSCLSASSGGQAPGGAASMADWFDSGIVQETVTMYVNGVAVRDISVFVGLSAAEINTILDAYTPYL